MSKSQNDYMGIYQEPLLINKSTADLVMPINIDLAKVNTNQ